MASSDPYLGSVDLWPLDWAPQGWVLCYGQTLPIMQYQALYALIGTRYGGDGRTTFAVPNMQGRVPVGVGRGNYPNPALYTLGQIGGIEQLVLTANQVPSPSHTHAATAVDAAYTAALTDPVFAASATGTVTPKAKTGLGAYGTSPVGGFMGPSSTNLYSTTANASMAPADVAITVSLTKTTAGCVAINKASAGSVTIQPNQPVAPSMPVDNRMPFLALNYMIAVEGTFPPRPNGA